MNMMSRGTRAAALLWRLNEDRFLFVAALAAALALGRVMGAV